MHNRRYLLASVSIFLIVLLIGVLELKHQDVDRDISNLGTGSEMKSYKSLQVSTSFGASVTVSDNVSLEDVMRSRPNYFGFGLYSKPIYPAGIFKSAVHYVNGSFSGYLLLANANGNDYILLVLLDYREVPFYLNGTLNLTHHIALGNMKYEFLRFVIPNISEGRHDVFIGVFPGPYSTEEQDPHVLYGFRLQIISGSPLLRLPTFEHPQVCTRNNTELDAYVLLTDTPCDNTLWYMASLKANSTLRHFAILGNTRDNVQTFALVRLLDYRQVPIGNRSVYFGYLYKNEIVSIPLSMNIPKRGTHRLILLYFSYPYENLEYPLGIENVNLRFINEQSNVLILHVG